ncbi:putative 60S ribosomal protein L6E [Helianthus anomalus]
MAQQQRKRHVFRNPDLIRGVGKYLWSRMYHKRGLWAIKAKNGCAFPKHEKKAAAAAPAEKPPKFYPADDVKKPLVNKRKARPTKLRCVVRMVLAHSYQVNNALLIYQEKNVLPQDKMDDQKLVDAALIKSIEVVPDLKSYLCARFSLKAGMKPHELIF